MRIKYTIILLIIILLPNFLHAQQWGWVKQDFNQKLYSKNNIIYDPTGSVILTFDSTVTKYNLNGQMVWSKIIQNAVINSIAVNNQGEIFATGSFKGKMNFGGKIYSPVGKEDLFVSQFSANGGENWLYNAGSPGFVIGKSISVCLDNTINVTGGFSDTLFMGNFKMASSQTAFFITKFNSLGQIIWAKQSIGGSSLGIALRTDSSGNSISLTHVFQNTMFDNFTISNNSNGNAITNVLLKYDAAGKVVWAKNIGESVGGIMKEMNKDKGPNTYTGNSSRYVSAYISKFDNSGNSIWSQPIGSTNYSMDIASVSIASDNSILLTGSFGYRGIFCGNSYPTGLFMVKWNSDGNCVWSTNVVGSSYVNGGGIVPGAANKIYVSGTFSDTARMGGFFLPTKNSSNVFVAQLVDGTISSTNMSEDNLSNSIVVFPNPSKGQIKFQIHGLVEISIKNILGQEVLRKNYTLENGEVDVDISHCKKGLYFLQIISEKRNYDVKRILLE